jgi:radical SAM protein with 4Fe4S-binding SPASM domain
VLVVFITIPKNIDFLNVGYPCNQNCRQCFYLEERIGSLSSGEEQRLIRRIVDKYPNTTFFVYPKELTTSKEFIPLFKECGQSSTLSNGKDLDNQTIEEIAQAGIREVKITLFANLEQQSFFNGNSGEEYRSIKSSVQRSIDRGLRVTVYNILDQETICSIEELCTECSNLGVQKIEFLRLTPVGKALALDSSRLLRETDLERAVCSVEAMKKKYPTLYLSFNLKFGPNFCGLSLDEAKQKIMPSNRKNWNKTNYLCPAINCGYLGLSLKSGNAYWCFFLLSKPEISRVGFFDFSREELIVNSYPDLSTDTLRVKLRGNCSKESCFYQEACLGGCRSAAYLFAQLRGEQEPLYAGVDLCLTRVYENLYKSKRISRDN